MPGKGTPLSERSPELYAQIQMNMNKRHFPEIDISKLTASSDVLIWWVCPVYQHCWLNTPRRRFYRNHGCPVCSGLVISPGWNCLKTKFPEVFKELHFDMNKAEGINIGTLAPAAPTLVWWKCKVDRSHVWRARISSRTGIKKTGCPHCVTFRNEKEFRDTFNHHTNMDFISGHILAPRELFKSPRIQIDLLNDEHKIAIEYDGNFSHGGNNLYGTTEEHCRNRDLDTTNAILNAGYTLIRIRETPLAHLPLEHPNLKQLSYNPKHKKTTILKESLHYLQTNNKAIQPL